jgi:hypothetical protein
LSIYNDDLKLAIVNILNATPVDQFQYKESTQLAAILKDYKNVGTGKNEEVLGTIFLILTKYVKFGELQSVKPFIKNMRVPCIEETLDILGKNMSRDLRAEEEEQGEKDMLSIAATLFLKVLSRKPETGENKLGKVSSQMNDIIKEIIINEMEFNPRNAKQVEVEKTIQRHSGEHLISYLKELRPTTFVFFRLLNHLADVLIGKSDPWFQKYMRDITNEEFQKVRLRDWE